MGTTIADIFKNDLRGHAYIEARGLSPQLVSAHQHTCESCRMAEELPRIQRLMERWGKTAGRELQYEQALLRSELNDI